MEKIIDLGYKYLPTVFHYILILAIGIVIIVVGAKLINKYVKLLKKRFTKKNLEPGVISFLCSAIKIVLYALLIMLVAEIWGLATSTIVAACGSSFLAIGFALQGSLSNFAGGVLILVMKPFVVNDYIIVGDVEGTVKKIDIVYTTLHTADNRIAILPNGKLADSNIINTTKEGKRRVDVKVGVGYNENLDDVKKILFSVIEMQDNRLTTEPTNVVVSELADSSVVMLTQLWVRAEEYGSTYFKMLEDVKREFEKNDIEIPYNKLDININK